MYKWKVVPLCEEQLLDIKPEDVLPGGIFRTCDVYKSGGGYDKFPEICKKRLGLYTNPKQFVVQLQGCHLKCPYCYVTPNGVHGDYIEYTTEELLREFFRTGLDVFHLMGGSPALYLHQWPELIEGLAGNYVFHSDLTLTERKYGVGVVKKIRGVNCLYAVNIKGVNREDYEKNTGVNFNNPSGYPKMVLHNLGLLIDNEVPFYITFTNPNMKYYYRFCAVIAELWGPEYLDDSFIIDIIDYDAVKAYNEKGN